MKTREFSWKTIDQLEIYGKYWAPDASITAVVALVHGMGEHINRYERFATQLTEAGYAVIGFDQRGHGRSEGKRGHTPSYEHLLICIDDLLHKAVEYFPETPIVLMGHSMGGNLVLNYLIEKQPLIKGAIVSSPYLKLAFEPPAIKVMLGKLVNKVYPGFSQSTNLDVNAISRIPEEVALYEKDTLVHDRITSNMYLNISEKGLYALEHAEEVNVPLLVYHGTGDTLTSHKATADFTAKASASVNDITLKLFDGAYHETHHDLVHQEQLQLVIEWLDKRLKNA